MAVAGDRAAGQHGTATLPFTGFPLWVAAIAGVLLLGAGIALGRPGRTTA